MRWRQARKALDEAREKQDQLQQESERLGWQIGELDKLGPAEGEWEELNMQHGRLAHAQSLIDAARLAIQALDEAEPPATQGQLEGLFGHLGEALDDIDFHKGRAPEMSMQRLRRLFLRTGLDAREVRLLRGILSDAQRMARLARGG